MKTTDLGLRILSTWDVETEYGINDTTVFNWCKNGYLPAEYIRNGKRGHYEFTAIDFALFLYTEKAGKHRKEIETVPVGSLSFDPDIPGRAQVYLDTVEEYALAMKNGEDLPPMVVARIDDKLLALEGAHRYQSCLVNRETEVSVQILEGLGRDDAFALALEANSKHGRQLNAKDKRTKVLQALKHPKYANLSTRDLAKRIRVSHNLVSVVRRELEGFKNPHGAPKAKREDANTPARIIGKIHGQLKFLKITHPEICSRIAEILAEVEPQAHAT